MKKKLVFALEKKNIEKLNKLRENHGCQRNLPLLIQAMMLAQKEKALQ